MSASGKVNGPCCTCSSCWQAETRPPEIETLRKALAGLLEIEDARLATGAFKPNDVALKRIEAARAALEERQG